MVTEGRYCGYVTTKCSSKVAAFHVFLAVIKLLSRKCSQKFELLHKQRENGFENVLFARLLDFLALSWHSFTAFSHIKVGGSRGWGAGIGGLLLRFICSCILQFKTFFPTIFRRFSHDFLRSAV